MFADYLRMWKNAGVRGVWVKAELAHAEVIPACVKVHVYPGNLRRNPQSLVKCSL